MPAISRVDTATDPPGRKRRLVERFCYSWTVDGVEYWMEVPSGFAWRVSFPILPRRYALEDPSCVHDALYLMHSYLAGRVGHDGLRQQVEAMELCLVDQDDAPAPLNRRVADRVLLTGPEPTWMQWVAYAYARAFGWWMWHDIPQQIAGFFRR